MTTQAYRVTRQNRSIRNIATIASISMLSLTGFAFSVVGVRESQATELERVSLYGTSQRLGNGTMRTYVEVVNGEPTEVGVALSERALEGLPSGHHDPGGIVFEGHHMMWEYVLDLPADNPTPFQHVALNWNLNGHEPAGIYDKPHFDFHFNLISDAERKTITLEDPAFEQKASNHPAPTHVPVGYAALPGGVPLMGAHWIDPTSPELNGQQFGQTFIFGTWDGELIFAEPMITKAFLDARPSFTAEIPVPEVVDVPGYYPTRYGIRWDEERREYRVSLEGLVKK
jgi:hypothetical protein